MVIFLGMNPAEELRFHLQNGYRALSQPGSRVLLPSPSTFIAGPCEGHFHLRPELFVQGAATTRFDFPGERLDLGPGEILIVPSRVHHAETVIGPAPFANVVIYAGEGHLWCHLADGEPMGKPRVSYPEHLNGPECAAAATWLEEAVRIFRNHDAPEVVTDLVRSLLGMALRLLELPAARGLSEPLPVVRCRQMIHESLGDPDLSVASLAQRLGCNPDYLSHLFRMVRGEKLTAYIEELRMLRAAELLSETALSCKEAGWASGYRNQSYFIRCFRKRWGCPPGEFRKTSPLSQKELEASLVSRQNS